MMKTWTLQKGFPLVTVQRKGKELHVQQERFFLNMKPDVQPSDARYISSFPAFYLFIFFCILILKFLNVLNPKFRETYYDCLFLRITWKCSPPYLPRQQILIKKINAGGNNDLPIHSFYSYLWHIPLSYITGGRNHSDGQLVSLLDKKSGLTIIFCIKKSETSDQAAEAGCNFHCAHSPDWFYESSLHIVVTMKLTMHHAQN